MGRPERYGGGYWVIMIDLIEIEKAPAMGLFCLFFALAIHPDLRIFYESGISG